MAEVAGVLSNIPLRKETLMQQFKKAKRAFLACNMFGVPEVCVLVICVLSYSPSQGPGELEPGDPCQSKLAQACSCGPKAQA